MPRLPGRPRQTAAAPSRETLLALAFDEFANKPFANVSVRALARKADVSDSLFNHYFGGKEGLWQAVVTHYVTSGFTEVRASLRQPDQVPPLEALGSHIRALLALACEQPGIIRLVLNALTDDAERAGFLRQNYLHPYLLQLDRQLERCREQGLIKPLSSHAIHAAILGWVHILIKPGLLGERPDTNPQPPDRVTDDLMTLMMHGLVEESVSMQSAGAGDTQTQ